MRGYVIGLLAVAAASHSLASAILQGPTSFPAGAGSSTTILAINTDTTGSGSGCVGFINGADVTGPGACPGGFTGSAGDEATTAGQTATRTMEQLSAAGVTESQELVLILQPADAATGTLSVQDLALVFFDPATDGTFTVNLPGTPLSLPPAFASAGQAAGFAFTLDSFEAGLASSFFENGADRVGAALTLTGGGRGAARLFIAPAAAPASVPEPATFGITAAVLLGIAAHKCRSRG